MRRAASRASARLGIGVPDRISASGRLGVTTRARQQLRPHRPDTVFVDEHVAAALAIITRIDDDHRQLELDDRGPDCFRRSPPTRAFRSSWREFGCCRRRPPRSVAVTRSATTADTAVTPTVFWAVMAVMRARAIDAERRERLQIGLMRRRRPSRCLQSSGRSSSRHHCDGAHRGRLFAEDQQIHEAAESFARTSRFNPAALAVLITSSGATRSCGSGPGPPLPGWKSTTPRHPCRLERPRRRSANER